MSYAELDLMEAYYGVIDEVALFNTVLTADDIKSIMCRNQIQHQIISYQVTPAQDSQM
jgi:hypothetical protein